MNLKELITENLFANNEIKNKDARVLRRYLHSINLTVNHVLILMLKNYLLTYNFAAVSIKEHQLQPSIRDPSRLSNGI